MFKAWLSEFEHKKIKQDPLKHIMFFFVDTINNALFMEFWGWHQSLSSPGAALSNPVVYPKILAAKNGAFRQQTFRVVPEAHVCASRDRLHGVRRCRQTRAGARDVLMWMADEGARAAVVSARRRFFAVLRLVLAQLRVTKSPNHSAEVEEESPHD